METFTKLESRIIGSTIWTEDDHTRLLWITMLALADRDGYVGASVPGLASLARIPLQSAEIAIEKFLAPDKYSRSQEFEGRRIEVAERGWKLLNYARIRGIRDTEDRREYEAERKRNYRSRKVRDKSGQSHDVPSGPALSAQAETETESRERGRRVKDTSSDFQPDAPPMILATHLLLRMKENNPGVKEPNLQAWARTIDLMIRKDNRSPVEIRRIIDWCQADSGSGSWAGWKANILSAEKLRAKFDTLVMHADAAPGRAGGNGAQRKPPVTLAGNDVVDDPNDPMVIVSDAIARFVTENGERPLARESAEGRAKWDGAFRDRFKFGFDEWRTPSASRKADLAYQFVRGDHA